MSIQYSNRLTVRLSLAAKEALDVLRLKLSHGSEPATASQVVRIALETTLARIEAEAARSLQEGSK